MTIDGNAIADDILREVAAGVQALGRAPVLAILTSEPNFETQRYLALKCRKAAACGVRTNVIELPPDASANDVRDSMRAAMDGADGIIVQLPFPPEVDIGPVLESIPPDVDVDALNPQTRTVLSPVVGACEEILKRNAITVAGKHAAVIGYGRLVGAPVERWLRAAGAEVRVITKDAEDAGAIAAADIVVCGAGVPGMLKPEMVKEGVAVLDAGTSEEGGLLRGDADPLIADKAALFTPVPGGIGPVTVAMLLRNLLTLAKERAAAGRAGSEI
jgi:methylenetetrahydrofolate dehydrogenase (NADP+)/methenyltetrahydrofolate cyclohydrolase